MQKRPRYAAFFRENKISALLAGFRFGRLLARLAVGRMWNRVLVRWAEGIDRLVMAPMGVKAVVLLDAFVYVLAHFLGPGAVLPFEEKALAAIGCAFAKS